MKLNSIILITLATLGSTVAAMAQNLPSYLPANGLVGWWPFNGNANDESGNGNNGIVNGATLTNNRFDTNHTAYYFDGFSSGIVVENVILSNSPASYSINFWCKLETNSMDANGYTIFDDCDSIQWLNKGRFITLGSGGYTNPNFNFREEYGNIAEDLNPSYFEWTNYCCVLNTEVNLFYLYKNGVLLDSSPFNPSFYATGNRKMQFGRCQSPIQYNGLNYYTSHWLGCIDDIAIWNRALTQQEITALYTASLTNINEMANTIINVPGAISYQAVARDAQGTPLANANLEVQFSLLADSLTGTAEYTETHTLTTNEFGLFTTAFGAGTSVSGTFSSINWSVGNKYLHVQMDTGGGWVDMGTQQLLATPYSMHSATSGAIKNPGLPVFSDNAAAIAGGLSVGEMYRTAGGVLMVVY